MYKLLLVSYNAQVTVGECVIMQKLLFVTVL